MTFASVQAGAAFPVVPSSFKQTSATKPASARAHRAAHRRIAALIAASLLTAAAVSTFAHPDTRILADPELARLLRGMALIKAAIVLPVLALLVCRLRSPLGPRLAIAYTLAACAMSAATSLIWQLTAIAPAALLFHLGALALLLLAWRDDMPRTRLASLLRQRETGPAHLPPPA